MKEKCTMEVIKKGQRNTLEEIPECHKTHEGKVGGRF